MRPSSAFMPPTLAVVVALFATSPAPAQVGLGLESSLADRYVWRGLPLTEGAVAQPSVWAAVHTPFALLKAGAWGNVELGAPGPDELSLRGTSGLGEVEYFVELEGRVAGIDLAGGGIYYTFFGHHDASEENTLEVFGKATLPLPLAPSLALYQDLGHIGGAYLEGRVSHELAPLRLQALAGFSAGQETAGASHGEAGYFADRGFTHLDLSASLPLELRSVTLTPTLHLQRGFDAATERVGVNDTDSTMLWIGFHMAWSSVHH